MVQRIASQLHSVAVIRSASLSCIPLIPVTEAVHSDTTKNGDADVGSKYGRAGNADAYQPRAHITQA